MDRSRQRYAKDGLHICEKNRVQGAVVRVLVTGGAGYIGSHTCLELLRAGHEVHVVDSLYNGHIEALARIRLLSNRELELTECDVRNGAALDDVFAKFKPEAVIHFAGLKAVGESVAEPARSFDVNVGARPCFSARWRGLDVRGLCFRPRQLFTVSLNICLTTKRTPVL